MTSVKDFLLEESDLVINPAMEKKILNAFEEWLKQFVVTDPIYEKHQIQNSILNALVQKLLVEVSTIPIVATSNRQETGSDKP